MINTDDYTLRISQASPAQLVVINYELIEAFLTDALEAYGPEAVIRAEDKPVFAQHIEKAKNGLTQLIRGLNFEIIIAHDLYQIYEYVNGLLNAAYFSYKRDAAAEALSLMRTLLEGWREAARQEPDAAPVTDGAPQVYAGLTYQKDGLSEYVVQDNGRGYQA